MRTVAAIALAISVATIGVADKAYAIPAQLTGDISHVVCINGYCYYHGNTFSLGKLTLGDLKRYCSGVSAASSSWHLGTEAELQPGLHFFAHGVGLWGDFAQIAEYGLGYMLVTGNASESMASAGDKGVTVDVYELQGNRGFPALSYLGLTAIHTEGRSLDTAPLTDGYGNVTPVKVICVMN
jgi:hypothetical protein